MIYGLVLCSQVQTESVFSLLSPSIHLECTIPGQASAFNFIVRIHYIQRRKDNKSQQLFPSLSAPASLIHDSSYRPLSNLSTGTCLQPCESRLLLCLCQSDTVSAEVINRVPFSQECVTQDCQGTDWLGNI